MHGLDFAGKMSVVPSLSGTGNGGSYYEETQKDMLVSRVHDFKQYRRTDGSDNKSK
jgi:hypothetical protein